MNNSWVIIVNYRTPQLTCECLESLSTQTHQLGGGKVIVVDNASDDGSFDIILDCIERNNWANWSEVISADRNGGFSYGNNTGIRYAFSQATDIDYFILLNPDTVTSESTLRNIISYMKQNDRAGIAGGMIKNSRNEIEISSHRMHSPISELESSARLGLLSRLLHRHVVSPELSLEKHKCDWVSGAFMIIRNQVIKDVGFMDESYFLYFEEVDYCWRARDKEWEIWYVPESQVMHIEGASTNIKNRSRRASYWYNSRRRFFVKFYGISGLILADLLWFIGRITYLFRKLVRLGAQGESNDPKWYMFDLLWGDFKSILSGKVWKIKRTHG